MLKPKLALLILVPCLSAFAAGNFAVSSRGTSGNPGPAASNGSCSASTVCASGRAIGCTASGDATSCTAVPGVSVACSASSAGYPPAFASDACP
jgi:hypothetical protein